MYNVYIPVYFFAGSIAFGFRGTNLVLSKDGVGDISLRMSRDEMPSKN